MREGWDNRRIDELCDVIAGQSPKSEFYNSDRIGLPFYQGKKEFGKMFIRNPQKWTSKVTKEANKGDILMSVRAPVGPVNFSTQTCCIGRGLAAIRCSEKLDKNYCFYFLRSIQDKLVGNDGAVFNSINKSQIGAIEIPIPPLSEQKAIVKVLDEAFAKIDQAKTNIEKNIENAKELFQSKLNEIFSHPSTGSGQDRGEGWEEKSLGEVVRIIGGGTPSKKVKDYYNGNIPWATVRDMNCDELSETNLTITEEGLKNSSSNIIPEGEIIVATRVGLGKVCLLNQATAINQDLKGLIPINKDLNREFLFFWYKSIADKVEKDGVGMTVKGVNLNYVKALKIHIPEIEIQENIVSICNNVKVNAETIESLYHQKLAYWEDLKKSVLQKAFSGELTKEMSFESEVQNFSSAKNFDVVEGISKTDLQVGLTSIALDQHIKAKREDTFHHVKAEKIVHLAQYILNVDIDRKPVRDAAGPNDFKHSKKIESRARKAGFYTVEKHGERYNYSPGSQFQTIIDKTRSKLEGKVKLLDSLLKECLRMNTTQAEVVATLYAGWNDLIIQGSEITDETIVYASREDWHESKLEIPRERFFKALDWMKNNELFIPKGNGLLVVKKEQVK